MDFDPLSISLEPGMERMYPFGLRYYALVMRRARDPDAAARVAAAISQADWAQMDGPVLFQDDQPILSDNVMENLRTMQEVAKQIQGQIQNAKGAEKTNLSLQLAELEQRIAESEKDKYLATMEGVEAYRRDVLPFLRPSQPSLIYDWDNMEDQTFSRLFRQFTGGTLSAEQFSAEADRVLRLMEREGQ